MSTIVEASRPRLEKYRAHGEPVRVMVFDEEGKILTTFSFDGPESDRFADEVYEVLHEAIKKGAL
jgi:hypothetical protein